MSDFLNNNELSEVAPERPPVARRRKKRKNKKRLKRIYNIILVVLSLVLIFSAYKVVDYYWQNHSNNSFNDDIADEFLIYGDDNNSDTEQTESNNSSDVSGESSGSSGGGSSGGGSGKPAKVPDSVDITALKAKYKDAVGWIYSRNGVINYPIVQGKDNSYYLNRRPDGKKNINGSIFMDYTAKADFSSANTVIYGHSMDNGSMFKSLLYYKKQSYYNKYPEMYIYTPSGKHKLVIFAAYETNSKDMAYGRILGEAGFKKYVSYALSKSKIKTDVEVNVGDKLVTLSTCAYSSNDARFIVVGKLIKYVPEATDSTESGVSSDVSSTESNSASASGGYYDSIVG